MGSARKPVIVRKFSRDGSRATRAPVFGQDAPALEILDLAGKVLRIGWEQVKWVCYVRDFPAGDRPTRSGCCRRGLPFGRAPPAFGCA